MTPTALITGGSGGIGFELAKLFAADGYRVILVARKPAELERAAAVIAIRQLAEKQSPASVALNHEIAAAQRPRNDETVITIAADLTDPGAPKRIVDELAAKKINIDVLVNNAGFGALGALAATDLETTLGMVQLNVTALTELTRRLLPAIVERKRGKILNVASTAAFQPGPFMAVYYATKAYVLSFSEAISEELRGTGITVTTLCPGPTATSFQARAQIEAVPLFRTDVMAAATVAQIGYAAMNRGQRLVIPGLRNSLGAFLIRLAPRALVLRFIRSLQN